MNKFIPGKLACLSFLFLILTSSHAQDFTWIKGLNQVDKQGSYGTIGTPAPANNPGGRSGAMTWKDASGNFWLYGGLGYDGFGAYGYLSDLWKYTVSTNQWTYIKGSDIINQISSHGAQGFSTPSTKPGGRHQGATWVDNAGNLWLMGGYGFSGMPNLGFGVLNDLWRYNIATNSWFWINGGQLTFETGKYGTMGTPSSTNTPGARHLSTNWVDNSGDLWLFGGYGCTTTSLAIGSLQDVWRYNIANNTWTWMKGSSLSNQNGTYGTVSVPATGNTPGGRQGSTGWLDGSGNFILFGGEGWDQSTTTSAGYLNDQWRFNMSTQEWSWMRGSSSINPSATYGNTGTGNPANTPGGRTGAVSWKDVAGNVWLFGGKGKAGPSVTLAGGLNDLWKYNPSLDEWTWMKGPSLIDVNGVYGTQMVPSPANSPGARVYHSSWIDASNDLYIFGGLGQPASGVSGSLNDLWKYTNCEISPITMTITSNDSTICAGETASLTAIGSSNYLWLHNLALTGYVQISPAMNTTYTVVTADSKGCKYQASFTQTVVACAGIEKNTGAAFSYALYPNPNSGIFYITVPGLQQEIQMQVYNAIGQRVLNQVLLSDDTSIKADLPKGVYYYKLNQDGVVKASGKFVRE